MVYCGKPSGGCENCRKLHKKCDERHPDCSRCVKSGKKCAGYRNKSDLMFRDETARTEEKVQQRNAPWRDSISRLTTNPASLISLLERISISTFNNYATLPRSLPPPEEDIAICNFYHSIAENLSDVDPAHYLHQQLSHLYARSNHDSFLRLATQAISYAASTKLIPRATLLSRKRYIQALGALRKAIQDSVQNADDQTLYGVLLLCGYETMTGPTSLPSSWGAHVDGAAALVKLRANSNLHSLLSRHLFCFVRKSVVLSQMQISQPVDEIFFLGGHTSLYEDPENQLILMAAKIPDLQHQHNHLLGERQEVDIAWIQRLVCRASALDFELSTWENSVPISWSYAVALNADNPTSSKFAPRVVHRYPDLYIARVWNFYRVSRLILQSILLRAASRLLTSTDIHSWGINSGEIERRSVGLVDDICASVPYLLGHDLSKMKLHSTHSRREQDHSWLHANPAVKNNVNSRAGKFSVIWPLHVACSARSVPLTQKTWMRTQLRLLAEHGEPQACAVCEIESQTLLGAAETFRFDCV
ncbi:C6 zinc finger protein [Fusarium oxysporum f. sp. albedinis]|nr:C6 zinc finger protein [Fusarium oxysporum f. sp. albedinis]